MISFFAWDIATILSLLLFLAIIIVIIDKLLHKKNLILVNDTRNSKQRMHWFTRSIYFLLFLKTHKHEKINHRAKPVQWSISFYPVILLVLVLRSFLAEPFQIPSNSMMPTLLTGDFILVNKFIYGIRLPITNTKIFDIDKPKRGDVLVFRYPNYEENPEKKGINYIKRVIALPGDEIIYYQDHLWINSEKIARIPLGIYKGVESGVAMTGFKHYTEKISAHKSYDILLAANETSKWEKKRVPKGYYFVMGDNRARSADSRFFGFVPESFIIGKAFLIWMHWDKSLKFSRLGYFN